MGLLFDVNYDYPYLSGVIIMLIGFLISLATVTQVQQENTSTEAQPPAKRFA